MDEMFDERAPEPDEPTLCPWCHLFLEPDRERCLGCGRTFEDMVDAWGG